MTETWKTWKLREGSQSLQSTGPVNRRELKSEIGCSRLPQAVDSIADRSIWRQPTAREHCQKCGLINDFHTEFRRTVSLRLTYFLSYDKVSGSLLHFVMDRATGALNVRVNLLAFS